MKIWRFDFLKLLENLANLGGFFSPFCSMKNPLYRSKTDFFRSKFGEISPVKETVQVCTRVDAPSARRGGGGRRRRVKNSRLFPCVPAGLEQREMHATIDTYLHPRVIVVIVVPVFLTFIAHGGDKICWESKLRCREKALHSKCSLQSGF